MRCLRWMPDDVTDFDKVHEILRNEREKSVQYMNMVLMS